VADALTAGLSSKENMDFALLGTSHETLALVQAISNCSDQIHRLVAFVADDATTPLILNLAPQARRLNSASETLGVQALHAVIVDSTDPEVLETAKQLAGHSVAVLLFPRAAHGIEFIYQFGLIRDEQPDRFRLYPVRPLRLHPLALRFKEAVRSGELGRIHQLQWQREIYVAVDPGVPCLLSSSQLDEALLRDADLLKYWAGEFDQVTAIRAGDSEKGWIQASVNLGGPDALPVQWTCRGTVNPGFWQLTAIGDAGQISLRGSEDPSRMTWTKSVGPQASPSESLEFNWGLAVINDFTQGISGDVTAGVAVSEGWANELYRAFDLLEGTHRSLRRRRTVDLYFDTPSERGNFKSMMTAIGCSLLLLTILTILLGLGAGAIAKDLKLPPVVMQVVRVLVFAPLFLFLILQLGVFLAKPAAGAESSLPDRSPKT